MSRVPPATTGCDDSPPGKHRNDPKQIQPGQMAQGEARVLEKQVRQQMRSCGSVVGLQCMRDAADGKIMRYGNATVCRIPRDSADAIHIAAVPRGATATYP